MRSVPGLTYEAIQEMDAEKVVRYTIYLDEMLKMEREEMERRMQQHG